jgi:uncharacterized protein (DUF433 family)
MMVKSKPFTMRLSPETNEWVEQEARRTRRSKGAIVEALAEEGIRMRRFPGIAFGGPDGDRRAWVQGTAFDVWEIIQGYQDFGSLERLLAQGDLPERPIRLALAYYAAYPEEIDQAIEENKRVADQALWLYPTLVARG